MKKLVVVALIVMDATWCYATFCAIMKRAKKFAHKLGELQAEVDILTEQVSDCMCSITTMQLEAATKPWDAPLE